MIPIPASGIIANFPHGAMARTVVVSPFLLRGEQMVLRAGDKLRSRFRDRPLHLTDESTSHIFFLRNRKENLRIASIQCWTLKTPLPT